MRRQGTITAARREQRRAIGSRGVHGKRTLRPVTIEGRTIARSFWGKRWCAHLESFSDFANRLPRGRTYARQGSIWHLEIHPGRIEATVHGSRAKPYQVEIRVKRLPAATWKAIREACSGQIGTMLELLRIAVRSRDGGGLRSRARPVPKPRQIELACTCPDWGTCCRRRTRRRRVPGP